MEIVDRSRLLYLCYIFGYHLYDDFFERRLHYATDVLTKCNPLENALYEILAFVLIVSSDNDNGILE